VLQKFGVFVFAWKKQLCKFLQCAVFGVIFVKKKVQEEILKNVLRDRK
jgi:hypothetical protein